MWRVRRRSWKNLAAQFDRDQSTDGEAGADSGFAAVDRRFVFIGGKSLAAGWKVGFGESVAGAGRSSVEIGSRAVVRHGRVSLSTGKIRENRALVPHALRPKTEDLVFG